MNNENGIPKENGMELQLDHIKFIFSGTQRYNPR